MALPVVRSHQRLDRGERAAGGVQGQVAVRGVPEVGRRVRPAATGPPRRAVPAPAHPCRPPAGTVRGGCDGSDTNGGRRITPFLPTGTRDRSRLDGDRRTVRRRAGAVRAEGRTG